ncbi:ScbA/BarX family gamma-butyrolactone biosynthesis protein [Streptomyces ziwulingensis]
MTPLTIQNPTTTPPTPTPPTPRLTTTVPREYVHRATHAEVFLTGGERLDDTHFTLTGQWPRTHTFFTHNHTHHDPLQAAETIRQTGLYLAHTQYNVPLDHHFLMWELHITTHPDHMKIDPHPSELTLHAHTPHTTRKGKRLTEFTMNVTIHRNGHPCATGGGRFTCITPATYKRLRTTTHTQPPTRTHPHRTLHPTLAGRTHPRDTLLATTNQPNQWLLDPDPHQPTLFEHPTDHYPGLLLLEAARQAATAHTTTHNTPTQPTTTHPTTTHPTTIHTTTIHTTFHHYAEYHTPLYLHTTTTPPTPTHPHTTHHITGTQHHHTTFTTTIHTHPHHTPFGESSN